MDAAKNKAFLKSRMREAAQKREKRIDSPLVRYNELGQPVCKVCNVAVKSESLWPAHLASRQHKEAADKLKAQARGTALTSGNTTQSNAKAETETKPRVSSSLPDDFWDEPQAKRASTDAAKQEQVSAPSEEKTGADMALNHAQTMTASEPVRVLSEADTPVRQPSQDGAAMGKGAKGSLPEGFFDNVDADYRARGLEPPKYDIQDEWKEFQKSIRDDIQEADLRLEEEEFDAAEDREMIESLQQRELLDRVERLKKKEQEKAEMTEITEVIAKVASRKPFMNVNLALDEDSSSDDDSEDENALLDWRAKHF